MTALVSLRPGVRGARPRADDRRAARCASPIRARARGARRVRPRRRSATRRRARSRSRRSSRWRVLGRRRARSQRHCTTCSFRVRAGRAGRPGRAVRGRQDDDRPPGRPAVRRERRRGPDQRNHDVRDADARSLHDAVGVVTQDAHLFHDTIRANLALRAARAPPRASCIEALRGSPDPATWSTSLPDGLDTVVGDRGLPAFRWREAADRHRPAAAQGARVVVLDEATAHLDSESELAVQRALKNALTGRTSLVIATGCPRCATLTDPRHRRRARWPNGGRMLELLAENGLYADLTVTSPRLRTSQATRRAWRQRQPELGRRPPHRWPGEPPGKAGAAERATSGTAPGSSWKIQCPSISRTCCAN